MYKDIFRGFIIGSSLPVFLLFFVGFKGLTESVNQRNCVGEIIGNDFDIYQLYTLFAPLYLGIMTSLGVFIYKYFNLPVQYSFFIVLIISSIFVSVFITLCNIYTFDTIRLNRQYLSIIYSHAIAYIIAGIIYKLTE